MTDFGADKFKDAAILLARLLLVTLFLVFGWGKLTDYAGTASYMSHAGIPLPAIAAIVAIVMETLAPLALVLGIFTRPVALLMGVYTLAAGFLAHHYWTMTGAEQYANEINFFKNVSILGGFLLLYVTGAGKYALDAKLFRH